MDKNIRTEMVHEDFTPSDPHSNPRLPTPLSTLMLLGKYTRKSCNIALFKFKYWQREAKTSKEIEME